VVHPDPPSAVGDLDALITSAARLAGDFGPCDTGEVKTEEGTTRVREVRSRLVREGPSRPRDHERDFETVTLPERDQRNAVDYRHRPTAEAVPRCRAFRLPDPSFEPPFEKFRPF
jgi:hypothetical protein